MEAAVVGRRPDLQPSVTRAFPEDDRGQRSKRTWGAPRKVRVDRERGVPAPVDKAPTPP